MIMGRTHSTAAHRSFHGQVSVRVVPLRTSAPLDVVRYTGDTSFFREFLTTNVLNELTMSPCAGSTSPSARQPASFARLAGIRRLTRRLRASLVGKLEAWKSDEPAQNSQRLHGQLGSPRIPCAAHTARLGCGDSAAGGRLSGRQGEIPPGMIFKLTAGVWYTPDIAVIDGGASSEGDGTLVIEHQFDALTGFSTVVDRESLKLLQRLWKRGTPDKLLTKEGNVNEQRKLTRSRTTSTLWTATGNWTRERCLLQSKSSGQASDEEPSGTLSAPPLDFSCNRTRRLK